MLVVGKLDHTKAVEFDDFPCFPWYNSVRERPHRRNTDNRGCGVCPRGESLVSHGAVLPDRDLTTETMTNEADEGTGWKGLASLMRML